MGQNGRSSVSVHDPRQCWSLHGACSSHPGNAQSPWVCRISMQMHHEKVLRCHKGRLDGESPVNGRAKLSDFSILHNMLECVHCLGRGGDQGESIHVSHLFLIYSCSCY